MLCVAAKGGHTVYEIAAPLRDYLSGASIALALAEEAGDHPLIAVNPAFTALTGHGEAELRGRNCRMLQRDADNTAARTQLRAFLSDASSAAVRAPLVNFRKDGTPFVNLLFMSRLRLVDGRRLVLASQFDATETHFHLLAGYEERLSQVVTRMPLRSRDSERIIAGSLQTIASSAAAVAQARLMLADLQQYGHHG